MLALDSVSFTTSVGKRGTSVETVLGNIDDTCSSIVWTGFSLKFKGGTGMSNFFEKAFEPAKKFGTPGEISMDFASTVDNFVCDRETAVVSSLASVNGKGELAFDMPDTLSCGFVSEKGKDGSGNSSVSFESGRDCG